MTAALARRPAGFSLVELMVAMVIGLMTTLAIFQSYAANEDRKRTTTSGSEGLQEGIFALASLQRAVTNAGYNLTVVSDPGYMSPVRVITPGGNYALSNTNPPRPEFHLGCNFNHGMAAFRMAPLTATDGADGFASDTLTIFSGSSPNVPLPVPAETGGLAAGSSTIRLRSTWGFAVGDWVLVYEQSAAQNAGALRPRACTLARVTGLPTAPAISPADITISVPTASTYDEPVVVNLGPNPAFERYSVDPNGRLLVTDLLDNGAVRVLAENVVSMQLQLGYDLGNDDVIDEWANPPANEAAFVNPVTPPPQNSITALPAPPGGRGIHQIKAVRIGLLVRSPRFERPDEVLGCNVTQAGPHQILPLVAGQPGSRLPEMPSSGAYSLAGDAQCFRYNTVSVVAPVRNALLSEM